jgi:hypothetical protein
MVKQGNSADGSSSSGGSGTSAGSGRSARRRRCLGSLQPLRIQSPNCRVAATISQAAQRSLSQRGRVSACCEVRGEWSVSG